MTRRSGTRASNAKIDPSAVILAVDLGKTSCRIRVTRGRKTLAEARGPGAPGFAEADGETMSFSAITAALQQLPPGILEELTHCGIGAAGVEAGDGAARGLLRRLCDRLQLPATILNDAVAAHIGAFDGGGGTILITGTGSIAFGLGSGESLLQVDGWGPWLGDEGSGRWIGQTGLQRALRYADRRGPYTSLIDAAKELTPDLARLPAWISETGEPARRLASFAPRVLDHAQAGDTAAADIVGTATSRLAATAAAAGDAALPVAVVGGLVEHPYFRDHLMIALADRGLLVVDPLGDPLDGAALIAIDETLRHEDWAIRERVPSPAPARA